MKIERVNSYEDDRFKKIVLLQHGAFIINDEYKCSFEIINKFEAVVEYDKEISNLDEIIEEFRYYAPQISIFKTNDGLLIKSFPKCDLIKIVLKDIQPTQFYISNHKIEAIYSFIRNPEDIIIQVGIYNNKYISLDGHTRLFYAISKGFSYVYGCKVELENQMIPFIDECKKRNVYTPYDIKMIDKSEYEEKWIKFCKNILNSAK